MLKGGWSLTDPSSAASSWHGVCNEQVRPAAGKLGCCIVSRKTSRDLNGALLRGLFLGAHTSCLTPSVDVQSVPRFKHLDRLGRQVSQKLLISACIDGKSL